MNRRAMLGVTTILACLGAGVSLLAQAADTEEGGLSEVVVTATRREERLQDVPISVTAFSQEKLDAQGLRDIDDLTRLSPGIAFQRNGMSSSGNYNDEGSDINIRGIDSTAGTSTTGIYIDDTPIQARHLGFGSVNAFPALFDLDRVEVLRGPQGTLFGAGAEGGVVRFIAPEPKLSASSGYFRADGAYSDSGAPSYEAGAAFGTPIIEDVLAFRASVSFRYDGGWVDRVGYTLTPPGAAATVTGVLNPTPVFDGAVADTNANANWQQTTTARLAVKWKVNDALEITPSVYFQRLLIHDTAAYWIALSQPDNSTFRNGNALRNPSNDPFTLGAIKLKWDFGFASLFSNTAYYDRNQKSTSDYTQYLRATWSSYGELANTFPEAGDQGYALFEDRQRNFYQEIRLASADPGARLVWSTGLFFSHLKEDVPESIYDPTLEAEVNNYWSTLNPTTPVPVPVCAPPTQPCGPNGQIFYGPLDRVVDKQLAVFGEVSFRITDTFKATAGLRLSKIDYNGSVYQTGPFVGATIVSQTNGTEKPVTPKAVLSWQPNRDNTVYVSATKGFRPGGPNVAVGTICGGSLTPLGLTDVPQQYSSDSLWSYEIGSKNTLLDHKLQINASLFYVDWKNIQQNVYLPTCGEQFTANLGKAKSEGGDIEVLYRPVEALTLDLTAAYTDARLTKTSCAGSLTFNGTACVGGSTTAGPIASEGDALLGAPWSITASAEYHFPVWADRLPYLRIDYQHQTAQKSLLQGQDPRNAIYDPTLPGLPIVNNLSARAGLRFSGVDISVYGNNLTNSHPLLFESRDIATLAGYGQAYNPAAQGDLLYFGRGVRPRTIGVTATYRY